MCLDLSSLFLQDCRHKNNSVLTPVLLTHVPAASKHSVFLFLHVYIKSHPGLLHAPASTL